MAALDERVVQENRPLAWVADTLPRLTEPTAAELFSVVNARAGDLLPDHHAPAEISSGAHTGDESIPASEDLDQANVLEAPLQINGV